MFDFHEKRKIRSILYSKVTIGLIFLCAALLSMSVYERFVVEREMAVKRELKEQELEELQSRAAALESKVEHLQGQRGVEEELRKRFDVAKAGEEVIVLVDTDTAADGSSTRNSTEEKEYEQSFVERVGAFFGF